MDTSSVSFVRMFLRTHTFHFLSIVHFAPGTWLTRMRCAVVNFVVGTYCAVQSIEVRVLRRTVFTLTVHDIVYLLVWTGFAFQISEIPIFWMRTENASLSIPIFTFGFIANTSLKSQIVNSFIGARFALSILFVLSFRTEGTKTIAGDVFQGGVSTLARLSLFCEYFLASAIDFHTFPGQSGILKSIGTWKTFFGCMWEILRQITSNALSSFVEERSLRRTNTTSIYINLSWLTCTSVIDQSLHSIGTQLTRFGISRIEIARVRTFVTHSFWKKWIFRWAFAFTSSWIFDHVGSNLAFLTSSSICIVMSITRYAFSIFIENRNITRTFASIGHKGKPLVTRFTKTKTIVWRSFTFTWTSLTLQGEVIVHLPFLTRVTFAIEFFGTVPRAYTSSVKGIECVGLCTIGNSTWIPIVVVTIGTIHALLLVEIEVIRLRALDTWVSVPERFFRMTDTKTLLVFVSSSRAMLTLNSDTLMFALTKVLSVGAFCALLSISIVDPLRIFTVPALSSNEERSRCWTLISLYSGRIANEI